MKKFKHVRILTATSSFKVECSNWGSYRKTTHFSFKWAKPTLLHSFYTVLPIFLFHYVTNSTVLCCKSVTLIINNNKNKRTMMVIYSSPAKQLCILVEVSAKFTALRFLYKFYCPAPQRPCFFFHASWWLELNIERGSPKEQFCRYIEIGPVVSDKRIFKMSYIDI